MYFSVRFVLLATVFKWGCQALDGFGYELISAKSEFLEEKLEQLRNATIQLEKRQNETAEQNRLAQFKNENRQQEAAEQNSKMLQILKTIYKHTPPIDSCLNAIDPGRYKLKVLNKTFEVYCEQELYDGGWIVIQNRFNGSVDFFRNWTEYRNGFGSMGGEFWLGLEKIHLLTSSSNYELLVHLENFDGVVAYARYQKFAIGSEDEKYSLKTLDSYSGTAGDSLGGSKGRKFSTYDQNNDSASNSNCAKAWHGAWWYGGCSYSNLNGKFQNRDASKSMWWYGFKYQQGLKISKMLIRCN